MDERDWELLLGRIKDGKCTPFLGAGINWGLLPLGGEIAREWAQRYGFPLPDSDNLASVAQFIAVNYNDSMFPKEKILERLGRPQPDFAKQDELLEGLLALAELPFAVYLTTNYDDLMVQALKHKRKNPRRELCRWHKNLKNVRSAFDERAGYEPTAASPVVFHLHGHDGETQSLVLTEDDYLDFLVNISRNQKVLPTRIQRALTEASLLFIGYRLQDINFRVIYRGLVQSMDGSQRRLNVTVQLPPSEAGSTSEAAQKYLTNYFGSLNVRVYWGSATQFARELSTRWSRFDGGGTLSS